MNVNSLNINHEKTLLLISTNEGFLVYETTFFTLIYDSSKHDYEIGPLKFASPYFDSQLVLISGTSENIRIPENQISVWNSELNKSIAEVKFKENFNFFLIGKFTLAVFLPFKVINY